ncbi:MAG: type I-E CRISPR-associated endonuclease Cas1e [Pseudomonadota bacterium]
MVKNLKELPRFRDGLSYLYAERAIIEKEYQSIALYREDGAVQVPASAVGVLLLGPGTRITHAAVVALADSGTSVVWVGEGSARCYAAGGGKTRTSANVERQAYAWADQALRMRTVRRLYAFRFREELPPTLTLQQIRGREGVRVREAYSAASRQYDVPWAGRSYDRGNWAEADPVNRALSAGTACLYGVCHAALLASGFSPALGFIHVGKQLSFVYDVADLYKIELVVPAAFRSVAASSSDVERRVRSALRDEMQQQRLMERVINDLDRLFSGICARAPGSEDMVDERDRPGGLWEPDGPVAGGVNYAGNDARKGTDLP